MFACASELRKGLVAGARSNLETHAPFLPAAAAYGAETTQPSRGDAR